MAGYAGGNSSGGAGTYGYAPYQESALQAALRMAAVGAGAARGLSNPLANLAAGYGAASRQMGAEQNAAQAYAFRQAQAERQQRMDDLQTQNIQSEIADRASQAAARTATANQKTAPWEPPTVAATTPEGDKEQQPYQFPPGVVGPDAQKAYLEAFGKNAGAPAKPDPFQLFVDKAQYTASHTDKSGQLSDAALNGYARVVHEQGVDALTKLGFGGSAKAPLRVQVLNRHAELYPDDDLATIGATYRGTSGAISKIDANRAMIKAYGPTAIAAMNEVEDSMKGIPETGNQPLNYLFRKGSTLLGSPGMSRFEKALPIAQTEFARVITNPNLTGMLTNEQVNRLSQGSGANATRGQMAAAAKVLKYLYTTRASALDTERANLVGSISGNGSVNPKDPLGIRR